VIETVWQSPFFITDHFMYVRQKLSWKAIGLAGWAKKRAAFALETANHPSAAVGTGLTFFAIDEMAALVLAFRAIRCIEILDA
jgi:hypothetical protein